METLYFGNENETKIAASVDYHVNRVVCHVYWLHQNFNLVSKYFISSVLVFLV